MGHANDRLEFIAKMKREGIPEAIARLIMRHATTIQRLATEECSDEAAYKVIDREQARCPNCRDERFHSKTPIGSKCRECRAKARIMALCVGRIEPVFQGDPRGACVKLKVPSGRTDDWGGTGICVPTKEF